MSQSVNESIIEDLVALGIEHDQAVKMVIQDEDFDLWADAMENPASDF